MSSRAGRASIRCPGSWCPWSPWWSWSLCLSWCSLLCPGPVPWSGSLRCSWPCCRPSSAWSCRLPPVRIAAGVVVPVGVVVALVVLVAVKEQGGRVIGGRGGSTWRRACCSPGRADLGPGCSARCRIAGGVAGVFLVPVLVLAG